MQVGLTVVKLLLIVWTICLLGCESESQMRAYEYMAPPAGPEAADVLVGVNYYAGWWPSTPDFPNKWHDPEDGRNWLDDFPERTPLLGLLNDQETIQIIQEIKTGK